jgi:serine/threonine protein kinase
LIRSSVVPTVLDPGGVLGPGRGKPGDRLGKYELVCRLAIGGMAEIFLARASGIAGFEKLVVLKRILPQYAFQDQFVEMFLAEARLTATLGHPNIAHVYDIGTVDDFYFFTMEFVHGEDLNQLGKTLAKAQKPFPLEAALTIIHGVCAGLHHAHEACGSDGMPLGIVHRDVSPSNVLIAYDGSVKLVDFGIAKMTTRAQATRVGTLKGKISYMSPEQCRGEPLDRRSDVFAIGILLYEMTTGQRLFPGENEFSTLQSIVHQDVAPPHTLVPGYSPMLEDIVMMALKRDPAQRYETAEDMMLDLEECARAQGLTISPNRLSKVMHELYGRKIAAWTDAQRAGKSLGEHLAGAMVRAISATGETEAMTEVTPTSGIRPRRSVRSSALPFDVPLGLLPDKPAIDESDQVEIIKPARKRWWFASAAVVGLLAGGGVVAWRALAKDAPAAAVAQPPGPTVTPIDEPRLELPVAAPAPTPTEPAVEPAVEAAAGTETATETATETETETETGTGTAAAAGTAAAPVKKKKIRRGKRRAKDTHSDPDSPFED